MASGHPTDKFSFMYQPDTHKSKNRLSSAMNPVYSPVQPSPYGNPKNMAFTGYPGGYPATAPTYTPNIYQTGSPGYPPGYTTAGNPYKVPPTQTNGAPPPYTPHLPPTPQPCTQSAVPTLSRTFTHRERITLSRCTLRSLTSFITLPWCSPTASPPQPCTPPRSLLPPPQQRHGCYGDGRRDNHGHERRDSPNDTPACSDRSAPCYCANLQAPGDTWLQLCTASLVEPTVISGVHHCMQLLNSSAGAPGGHHGNSAPVCRQEQN
uniref:Uncharacterized protein n=1 Tax=Neogobius melanostomus TaxID=47308 RepID=A0A8C6U009_9GOBI